jgi:hypothetical protein
MVACLAQAYLDYTQGYPPCQDFVPLEDKVDSAVSFATETENEAVALQEPAMDVQTKDVVMAWAHEVMAWAHEVMAWVHEVMAWVHEVKTLGR